MSRKRNRNYDYRSHRQALYATLEAAVREEQDTTCIFDNSNNDDSHNNFGGRQKAEDEREQGLVDERRPAEYPAPLLWFEEMGPADFVAYHAAHEAHSSTSGCNSSGDHQASSAATAVSSSSLRNLGAKTPSTNVGEGSHSHGLRASDDRTANVAGGDSRVAEQTRLAPQSVAASLLSIQRTPSDSIIGGKRDRNKSHDGAEVAQPPAGHDDDVFSGKVKGNYSQDAAQLPPTANPTSLAAAASAVTPPSTTSTDTNTHECEPIRIGPSQQHPSSASPSQMAATKAVTAETRRDQNETVTPKGKSTSPTRTCSSQILSQWTQSAFLPGLPSQVMVTQQCDINATQSDTWRHDTEEENGELEELEETPQSEYALSMPMQRLPNSSHVELRHPDMYRSNIEEAVRGGTLPRADCSKVEARGVVSAARQDNNEGCEFVAPGGDDPPSTGGSLDGERERSRSSATSGRHARALQHEALTRALTQSFGPDQESGRAFISRHNHHDGVSGQHRQLQQQRFVFVPTEEALPPGLLRPDGKAGVIALLERRLTYVQERGLPGGYAARALELACHVLRQPKVLCMGTVQKREGATDGHAGSMRPQMVASPPGGAVSSSNHAEIVGVAGLVWEILRVGDADMPTSGDTPE